MSKIVWDPTGQHYYETGVQKGVLYPVGANAAYGAGVPWNGLTKISESPSGAEPTKLYANDVKYGELLSAEEFGGTIEAYTYPDEFAECDGSATVADGVTITQQERKAFGLCYRTGIGNDETTTKGYKLHLVYSAKAKPSSVERTTVNESPEAGTMSWEFSTTPVAVTGHNPTAHLVVNSLKTPAAKMAQLEAMLYGVDAIAFDQTKTYAVGDYVTYTSGSPSATKTYRCKTAITTAGQWDASKWDEVNDGPSLPTPDEVIALIGTASVG